MPSKTRTRWAQLKVGILALIAMAILFTLVFLMSGITGLFKHKSRLITYLDDSAAIAIGAPVRLNGIQMGEVAQVELSGSSEPNRVVRVFLDVNDDYLTSIPVDSEASIAAETLLATKYINIKKGKAKETVKAGSEIKTRPAGDFNDVIEQGNSTLQSLQSVFKKLDDVISDLEAGKGTIGKFLVDETIANEFQSILVDVKKLTTSLNDGKGTVGKLFQDDQIYNEFRGTMARVDTLLDDLDHGKGTVGQLMQDPGFYKDARQILGDAHTLLADLNAGKGDLGGYLKRDDLHEQLKGTTDRLNALLDKISNGQGTISQLLNNPALHDDLDSTVREINGLMKDFRSNPKKFLRIKLAIF